MFSKRGFIGNPFASHIHHPLADVISYFEEPHANDCFEVAFFKNDKWVQEVIPELSMWSESDFGDPDWATRVYRFVPKVVVYTFLVRFEDKE
jgi:hypothetical protein